MERFSRTAGTARRGESGRLVRRYTAYSAGTAEISIAACQPNVGITKYAIIAARIQPPAQKLSSRTTTRPRLLAGTLSETSVEATGSSPPRPTPMKKRSVARTVNEVANADRPLARENKSRVKIKI